MFCGKSCRERFTRSGMSLARSFRVRVRGVDGFRETEESRLAEEDDSGREGGSPKMSRQKKFNNPMNRSRPLLGVVLSHSAVY